MLLGISLEGKGFHNGFNLVTQICQADLQKAASFKSDLCVS